MKVGQCGDKPHRGAPPRRNWTPTRADIVTYVGCEMPALTDAQAACFWHVTCVGKSTTTYAGEMSVSVQTVRQHLRGGMAKWEAWTGGRSRPVPDPEPQMTALERKLCELEAERADVAAAMLPSWMHQSTEAEEFEARLWGAFVAQGPRPDENLQRWEYELVARRMATERCRRKMGAPHRNAGFLYRGPMDLGTGRGGDYEALWLMHQDFIRDRVPNTSLLNYIWEKSSGDGRRPSPDRVSPSPEDASLGTQLAA